MNPSPAPQEPGVVITAHEMYQELRQVHDEVKGLRSDFRDLAKDRQDHESRLRALEARVWQASGAAIILGALAGYAAQVIAR